MYRRRLIALSVLVVLAVLLAGCSTDGSQTSPSVTATHDAVGTGETTPDESAPSGPPNSVQIARSLGEYPVVDETGFHYTGYVHARLDRVSDEPFTDVTLCLYDEQWNVVASRDLGTFAAGERRVSVDVHTSEVPEWMVVEHPDFRERSVFQGVLVRRDGRYAIGDRTQLDRAPPSRPGRCR